MSVSAFIFFPGLVFMLLAAEPVPPMRSASDVQTQLETTDVLACGTSVGTLRETVQEVALTLLVFLAAAGAIATMKKRSSQVVSRRTSADQLNKCAVDGLPSVAPPPRPTPVSLASSTARSSALLTRSLQGKIRAGDDVNFSPEGDTLAAAVRHGSARYLPSLLDGAESRAIKAGAHESTLPKLNAQHLLTALRACASRRCFREGLAAYSHMRDKIGDGCGKTWSLLLYCAVEEQELDCCGEFVNKLMSCMQPSGNDFVNMVRFYASTHDLEGLAHMLGQLRTSGFPFETIIRNKALSVCVSCRVLRLAELLADETQCPVPMDTIGYNTLMKAYANARQIDSCFDLYSRMQRMTDQGAGPSAVSFGILLDACIDAGKFDEAKQIFEDLRHSNVPLNVIHYTTLLKGLARAGHLDDATQVLEDMRGTPDTQPDLITYSTVVKALSDQGRTNDAMRVIELMLDQNIKPDGIILNIVLTSCAVHAMAPERVTHVFQWLRRHGLQITTATLSILIKAFSKTKAWEVTLDLLDAAPTSLEFSPPPRLYTQLAQACARAEEGAFVVRCYVSMVRGATKEGVIVDEVTNSRMYRLCTSCGESAVAGAVYYAVALAGGFPEPEAIARALETE